MKQHRLDVFALCSGVFFVALAVGFLLDGLETWDMEISWIAPALLIALGLGGVLSTVGRITRPDPAGAIARETAQPEGEPTIEPTIERAAESEATS